jgi:hypothetical protein
VSVQRIDQVLEGTSGVADGVEDCQSISLTTKAQGNTKQIYTLSLQNRERQGPGTLTARMSAGEREL